MKVCLTCHEPQVLPGERCVACDKEITGAAPRKGTDLAGAVVDGKYELTRLLGEGGMAWVYEGQQRSLNRRVAVKLMKPVPGGGDRRSQRFIREATTAARLMHPHILMILDTGITRGGLHYIVSEFLEGTDLGQLLFRQGRFPLARAVSHLNQVLAAVEQAHDHGVIHRDLKPDNIMIVPGLKRELIKVLDFGIAWTGDDHQRLTARGEAVGTPAYMSPEQIKGQEVGAWTDIYALGIVLFEMLTGRLPFEGDSVHKLMKQQLRQEPPAVHEEVQDVPVAVTDLIRRAMAKDPAKRYGSIAEFRQALFAAAPNAGDCMDCCDACHHRHEDPLEYCPGSSALAMVSTPELEAPALAAGASSADTRNITPLRSPNVPQTVSVPRETTSIEGLLVGALRPHSGEIAAGPVETWLVDRGEALTNILTLLRGELPLVQVVGPPGAGKTALLDETARLLEAQPNPPRVLRAVSDPWHTRAPWYPVRRLVSESLHIPFEPDEAALREAALRPNLAPEDLPGLMALFNLHAEPPRTEARFRETVCSALRALAVGARSGRLCVLLDDVDELDGCSKRFLAALSQMVRDGRGPGVVLASRSPLALDGGRFFQVDASALRLGGVETLLGRSAEAPTPAQAELLVQLTRGNPLHLDQAMRLRSEGALDATPEGSLRELMRQRLELLPAPALQVLRALSLTARAAPLDLLQELSPGVDLEVQSQLLIDRGYLGRGAGAELTLAHPLLADVVRESMGSDSLEQLHRQIHHALTRIEAPPLTLARQAYEARLGEASLALQIRAGDQACGWLDDEAAGLTHYQRGLHVARWELAPDVDGDLVFELSIKLGHALRRAGHHLGAEEAFNGSMDFIQPDPHQQARFHLGLGQVLQATDRTDEAEEQFLRACQAGGGDEVALQAHHKLAALLVQASEVPRAIEVLEQGVRAVCGDADPGDCRLPGTWRLVLQQATVHGQQGHDQRAVGLTRAALALASREQTREGEAQCYMVLGQLLLQADPPAALESLAAATVIYMGLGDRMGTARGLLLRAAQGSGDTLLAFRALALAQQIRWSRGSRQGEELLAYRALRNH